MIKGNIGAAVPAASRISVKLKGGKAKFPIIPMFQSGFSYQFVTFVYSCPESPEDGNQTPTVEFDRRPGLVSI